MKSKTIKEVDYLLLRYLRTANTLSFMKNEASNLYKQLGFTQDQLSVSLNRLMDSGLIEFSNGSYMLSVMAKNDSSLGQLIVYPLKTAEFFNMWEVYKTYRHNEHKSAYKTTVSEQAALNKLSRLAEGNDGFAIEILQETISNRWLGFEHGYNEIKRRKPATGSGQSRASEIMDHIHKATNK